jgi:hypothetical protein
LSLLLSLATFGGVLAAVTLAGAPITAAFLPPGTARRPERWGWSFAIGAALVSVAAAAALALDLPLGWASWLGAVALAAGAALWARLPEIGSDTAPGAGHPAGTRWLLGLLLASGVAFYLLRALTEPMWSNDYLAIWGLKAKTIFATRALPTRVLPAGLFGFTHPEYPLGLPLLYAGIASLAGRWDDHALALLFPFLQVATLAVLYGWTKRRGVSWPIPLAAAALLAQFEPLYSGFLTGMAEVPLSFAFLLFGTALSDSIDSSRSSFPAEAEREGRGARRRLAAASLLAAGTKNEGLFFAVAGAAAALLTRGPKRGRTAACAFLPAAGVALVSRWNSGNASLRDFDFAFLGPRIAELSARLATTIRAEIAEVAWPAWAVLACLASLFLAGRRAPGADRLLGLAGVCLAVYLFLPALAVMRPEWLVHTTLSRTAAALAPLVAAGLAGRMRSVES